MEKTNKKVLIIAIILSLITSLMIFMYIKSIQNANKTIEKQKIFIAARTIEKRSFITFQDIKEIEIEKDLINKNAILNEENIINRIAKDTIYEGEQFLESRLSNDENSTLSFEIPKDKRAVTINVNEASAVGYFINPGDYIDIIVTVEKESLDQIEPTTSKTLLQNILVLGVGQQKDVFDDAMNKTEKKSLNNSSNDINSIKTVTLAVSPQDVEKLSMSEQVGSIRLSLRAVGDQNIIQSSGITRDDLLY